MILPRNELTSQPPIVEFGCSSETPRTAAVCSSSSSSDQEEQPKEQIYNACDSMEDTEIVLSSPSPLYPMKSCLKPSTRRRPRPRQRSSWSGNSSFFLHNEDSISSFRSSFSSHESSFSSSMALTTTPDFLEKQQRPAAVVTFDEQVREKVFVPDWADPRVIAYERKQELQHKKNATAKMEDEHSELRRLDHCYVQVLLNLQRQKGSSNTTATKQKKQKNPFADSTVWCPRGLEVHWDPTIGARKRKVRLQSTCHILHTQALQRQRADNEDNDETSQDQEMADAYRPYSEPCQAEAHRQGLLDELDAHCDVGHGVLQVLQEHRRRSRVDSDEDAVAAADDASSVTSYSSCSSRSSACSIRSNAMVRRGKGRRSERFSKLLEEPESLSSSNAFPTH